MTADSDDAVVADLHAHTTNSDGALTLDRVPEVAGDAGLAAVAITDHDRPHPDLAAPVERRDGVALIHGIELRVDAGDQRVDLLGYGLDPSADLLAECERLQRDRAARGRAIVECVEDDLGVSLDVVPGPGTGRPHVARAIADATDHDVDWAFEHLIGRDCPCYVARDVPSFECGRSLLAESCALVGLAHPLRYPDPAAALALCEHLDAVERWYPYEGERAVADGHGADPATVDRAVERHDLVPTGGSDAHDDRLGIAGLDRSAFEPVRAALGLD